jgi:outer membrane protein assembly factor BamB
MRFPSALLPLVAAALLASCSGGESAPPTDLDGVTGATTTTAPPAEELAGWPRFGYDAARSNVFPGETGITAGNVKRLERQRVDLPGTADSSAIFLPPRLFVLTTSYGRTVAVDADSGEIVWTFVPEGIESWEGTSQITQATPVDDPETPFLYSYSPDGRVHKLRDATGREVRSRDWPAVVTRDPTHEKSAPALNLAGELVLLATGGYIGDAPPYQGHVVAIDRESGQLVNVFNALCSDREGLLEPSSCPETGAAIWGRGGVVVEPESGNLLVSTGNGEWNGSTHWGDSVLELSPDASRLVRSYTPENEEELDAGDVDLSSASPAFVPPCCVVQGGKDALLRLLDLGELERGQKGGEADVADAPGKTGVFTAPVVWQRGRRTWIFVADSAATGGYVVDGRSLERQWENGTPGTSPVLAGGLLYVYDPEGSGLHVYEPESGRELATLPAGAGHWNSPIVVDGRIALPEGSANDHGTSGVLDIYRLP